MADACDADVWMNEKEPLVTNPDFGKDEDTAQVTTFLLIKWKFNILFNTFHNFILQYSS